MKKEIEKRSTMLKHKRDSHMSTKQATTLHHQYSIYIQK